MVAMIRIRVRMNPAKMVRVLGSFDLVGIVFWMIGSPVIWNSIGLGGVLMPFENRSSLRMIPEEVVSEVE